MATLIIRNLPDDLLDAIERQARLRGCTLEEELESLLTQRYGDGEGGAPAPSDPEPEPAPPRPRRRSMLSQLDALFEALPPRPREERDAAAPALRLLQAL